MNFAELLGADGPFAQSVTGFAPRIQQQKMATQVANVLEEGGVLIAEAGTGTGKTFAYLVPAILSGQKVIISTGTRNLQDQLFHKDLPLVRKALAAPVRTALLKGRANYLCRHRLDLARAGGVVKNRNLINQLLRIQDWSGRTRSGDISEVTDVPEDSSVWPRVTSTAENCLGQNCPQLNECFVLKARRQAMEADILVINHHLFCADMVIKDEGFGEILPGADAFIIDEAHHLLEVASQFFGQSISTYQLTDLAHDISIEQQRDAADFVVLTEHAEGLLVATEKFRQAIGTTPRRASWSSVALLERVRLALQGLEAQLVQLSEALAEAAVRGKGLEQCRVRCELLQTRLQAFSEEQKNEFIYWFESRSRSVSLQQTPLDVSAAFNGRMSQYRSAWIFTSATLAIGEDFSHFSSRLGLQDASTLYLASPFDYARNALLYHPKGLPDPTDPSYNLAMLETALPVLQASRGRAFLLFTSYQALREAADYLAGRIDYPLLVQGSLPKTVLLERFRQLGAASSGAVLLGTSSFWEGVDVRGAALSCVVIAKLPFAAPGDPVMQARLDALRRRGGNPFMDYQLPQAVIALKQGVGRLIRDVSDRGVLMLSDPRLLSKAYGRIFLDSLPPMARTRSLEKVQRFFAAEAAAKSGKSLSEDTQSDIALSPQKNLV